MKLVMAALLALMVGLAGCANARIISEEGNYVVVKSNSDGSALDVAADYCDQFAKSPTLRRSETSTGAGTRRTYQCE